MHHHRHHHQDDLRPRRRRAAGLDRARGRRRLDLSDGVTVVGRDRLVAVGAVTAGDARLPRTGATVSYL